MLVKYVSDITCGTACATKLDKPLCIMTYLIQKLVKKYIKFKSLNYSHLFLFI